MGRFCVSVPVRSFVRVRIGNHSPVSGGRTAGSMAGCLCPSREFHQDAYSCGGDMPERLCEGGDAVVHILEGCPGTERPYDSNPLSVLQSSGRLSPATKQRSRSADLLAERGRGSECAYTNRPGTGG